MALSKPKYVRLKMPSELYRWADRLVCLANTRKNKKDRTIRTANRVWNAAEVLLMTADDIIEEARSYRREAVKHLDRLRRQRALG
jgi:hypothetical protein